METINICLKILTENKKAVKESFLLRHIPQFTSAIELKNYIVSEKVKAAINYSNSLTLVKVELLKLNS